MLFPLKLQSFLAGARETADRYLPYSLAFKLVAGTFITSLGGAGILSYLSDYATYFYAYSMGIRVPIEGVPYIKAAVSAGSFFALMTSALVFAFCVFAVRLVIREIRHQFSIYLPLLNYIGKNLFKKIGPENLSEVVQNLRTRSTHYLCFFIIAVSFAMALTYTALESLPVGASFASKTLAGLVPRFLMTLGICFAINLFIIFPEFTWPSSFAMTLAYLGVLIWGMFQPIYYGSFLRVIGYGGGLPITAKCKNQDLRSEICSKTMSLVLRTNDTYILFDNKINSFFEVPKDEFIFVSYKTGGLYQQKNNVPANSH